MTVDVDAVLRSALIGKPCSVNRRDHDWDFDFGKGIGIATTMPWRLVASDRIALASRDDDQWFGLAHPVNAATVANEILRDALVEGVEADSVTADLRVRFSNGIRLELFNDSAGYEGWRAALDRCEVIALGGGGFSVL